MSYGDRMTPPALRRTQQISASPSAVWAVLTDLESAASLLRGVESIELLTSGPYDVGTRWRETRTIMGGRETEQLQVLEAVPDHRSVISAAARGVTYTTTFTLTATSRGTDLAMEFSAGAGAPGGSVAFVPRVLARIGARVTTGVMEQDLQDIAAAAERRAADSGAN